MKNEPAGELAGVVGLKLLGFVTREEGLAKGLPLKLLLMVELVSEALKLGFGLAKFGEGDLFLGAAIDEK